MSASIKLDLDPERGSPNANVEGGAKNMPLPPLPTAETRPTSRVVDEPEEMSRASLKSDPNAQDPS